MANTTWNPADKSSGVNLTNSNLTATSTSGSGGGTRAVDGQSSGKYYFEITYTTVNTNSFSNGLGLLSAILTAPAAGTAYATRAAGNITINGSFSGSTLGIIPNGGLVGIAVDLTAKLIWFRLGAAGNWNGSGTANPATGAGGVSISTITSGPLYPMMTGVSGDALTANFGDSAFSGVVPSGYTAGWPTAASNYVDFSGNLGVVSLYGKLLYGQKLYGQGGAFAPAFAADLSFVTFDDFVGDLAPVVSFAADLNVFGFVNFAGDLALQIALAGSLGVDLTLTVLEGGLTLNVVLGASGLVSGPLWLASEPCPPPSWTETEPCPPPAWILSGPCAPVAWTPTRLCNG